MSPNRPPLILFEDDHLLVVNKPAGANTHFPGPYAGEGVYDWLRHREPRWAQLALIHRLDKETSGVMVFSKTALANQSLTQQFDRREVEKRYLLLTDKPVKEREINAKSAIVRAGAKYVSRPIHAGSDVAETRFKIPAAADLTRLILNKDAGGKNEQKQSKPSHSGCYNLIEAKPLTGRTHQIRVHAAEHGFPILGDALYHGTPHPRVCLHAAELTLTHPLTGNRMTFSAPVDFAADPRIELRSAFINLLETNAYRLSHGAADGHPGWYVDRLGDFLLSQSEALLTAEQENVLAAWLTQFSLLGAYHKLVSRRIGRSVSRGVGPHHLLGELAPERLAIVENGLRFELSLPEGYSCGLFLDQRDNRRRFLMSHVAAGFCLFPARPERPEMLNTFAHTCGFSVCSAQAGARITSIDLSKNYLDWGKRNFVLNGLDPDAHEFLHGDVFDWLRRLNKKGRRFDVVALDPPTFSQSKERGPFQVERDYHELLCAALPLVHPEGVVFASTNAAMFEVENFLRIVRSAVRSSGRKIVQEHYVPQPPDFPITREEPAHLKTLWLKLA